MIPELDCCKSCGYDFAGRTDNVATCPECGVQNDRISARLRSVGTEQSDQGPHWGAWRIWLPAFVLAVASAVPLYLVLATLRKLGPSIMPATAKDWAPVIAGVLQVCVLYFVATAFTPRHIRAGKLGHRIVAAILLTPLTLLVTMVALGCVAATMVASRTW